MAAEFDGVVPPLVSTNASALKFCCNGLGQRRLTVTMIVFFSRFPDWASLERATKAELENTLMPLGLWKRRAEAFCGLARYATADGGRFPRDRSELQAIPAVGQYLANAILLFQHDEPTPLLDTNMARVLERYIRPRRLSDIRYDPWLQSASKHLVSSEDATKVNWAILDLGGKICTPHDPKCGVCPLKRGCAYFSKQNKGTTDS